MNFSLSKAAAQRDWFARNLKINGDLQRGSASGRVEICYSPEKYKNCAGADLATDAVGDDAGQGVKTPAQIDRVESDEDLDAAGNQDLSS